MKIDQSRIREQPDLSHPRFRNSEHLPLSNSFRSFRWVIPRRTTEALSSCARTLYDTGNSCASWQKTSVSLLRLERAASLDFSLRFSEFLQTYQTVQSNGQLPTNLQYKEFPQIILNIHCISVTVTLVKRFWPSRDYTGYRFCICNGNFNRYFGFSQIHLINNVWLLIGHLQWLTILDSYLTLELHSVIYSRIYKAPLQD